MKNRRNYRRQNDVGAVLQAGAWKNQQICLLSMNPKEKRAKIADTVLQQCQRSTNILTAVQSIWENRRQLNVVSVFFK